MRTAGDANGEAGPGRHENSEAGRRGGTRGDRGTRGAIEDRGGGGFRGNWEVGGARRGGQEDGRGRRGERMDRGGDERWDGDRGRTGWGARRARRVGVR